MHDSHPITILGTIAGFLLGGAVAESFLQGVAVITASVAVLSLMFTIRAGRRGRDAAAIAYDAARWGVAAGILILIADAVLG